MTAAPPLIPGLDDMVRQGDSRRLGYVAERITDLFMQGAPNFNGDHVDLFDRVLVDLVPHTEIPARADLAERLSFVANAPPTLIGHLAREDELSVAGPVLRRSPAIGHDVLIEIAGIKGQGHLLAMTERSKMSSDLTDIILRRGDRDVVRRTAANAGALFSKAGYASLVKRAGRDGVLTLSLGKREDISDQLLKELVAGSIDVVRRRLLDTVGPARQRAVTRALKELSGEAQSPEGGRDFTSAQRTILSLYRAGNLSESSLLGFAKAYRYKESVAALSAMSGVPIAALDRLMGSERHDPVLLIGKAVGLKWATVRALVLLRLGPARVLAPNDIEDIRTNFIRLMPSTAERVVNFWRAPQSA